MVLQKLWVLQNFSWISLVSQSRFLSGYVHLAVLIFIQSCLRVSMSAFSEGVAERLKTWPKEVAVTWPDYACMKSTLYFLYLIIYSTGQKECKWISVLFNEIKWNFKWNNFSYEVRRIFERAITLIKTIIWAVLHKTDRMNIRAKYYWE